MATADVVTKDVPKVVKVPDRVTLSLTLREAIFLRNILGYSSGDCDQSAEELSFSIFNALDEANVPVLDTSLSSPSMRFYKDGGLQAVNKAAKKWAGV